ncbi:hypothetical protein ACJX0J_031220, partial [Zea mays]
RFYKIKCAIEDTIFIFTLFYGISLEENLYLKHINNPKMKFLGSIHFLDCFLGYHRIW